MKMAHWIRSCMVGLAACVTLWHCTACQTVSQTEMLMSALQEGKFHGSLVLMSDGMLGVSVTETVAIGPTGTSLVAEGAVDYRDADFKFPAKGETPAAVNQPIAASGVGKTDKAVPPARPGSSDPLPGRG